MISLDTKIIKQYWIEMFGTELDLSVKNQQKDSIQKSIKEIPLRTILHNCVKQSEIYYHLYLVRFQMMEK